MKSQNHLSSWHGLPKLVCWTKGHNSLLPTLKYTTKTMQLNMCRLLPIKRNRMAKLAILGLHLKEPCSNIKWGVWAKGLLRRFLITDRMSIHPRLSGKLPAEVLMWRTVWTTNNAVLPRPASSKPEQLLKRVTFTVGDLSYLAISGLVKPGPPLELDFPS